MMKLVHLHSFLKNVLNNVLNSDQDSVFVRDEINFFEKKNDHLFM